MDITEMETYYEDFDPSIISDGHSELLLGTVYEWDELLEIAENVIGIQWLNDARIIQLEKLQSRLEIDPESKRISQINFTMPTDECKLSQVFEGIPYGIIKKNRTGVGATTMELQSKRHSIIVVPTRALALNKALNSKLPNSNFYAIQYVGGYIPNIHFPTIAEYLTNDSIVYKKFIVVIDSLPKLLKELGQDVYHDYFIMFDEVDSLQDSSFYRDRIEEAFEYYYKFPVNRRSVVSATMFPFSNPILKKEPIINVEFKNPTSRNICLYPSIRPIDKTREFILNLFKFRK